MQTEYKSEVEVEGVCLLECLLVVDERKHLSGGSSSRYTQRRVRHCV